MKKNNTWFTFVELIISISISAILMFSIGLFVMNWMSNLNNQSKILQTYNWIWDTYSSLQESLENAKYLTWETLTWWFIFQTDYILWRWNFIKISSSWSTNACSWTTEDSQFFKTLKIEYFNPVLNTWSTNLYTNYLTHSAYSWTTQIWKWYFWNNLWININELILNNPTWIASYLNEIFISDTGNNRIIYFDKTDLVPYTLFDYKDWLISPTGLLFSWSTLYIANSGKKEIWKYEFSEDTWTTPSLTFKPDSSFTADNLKISFFDSSNSKVLIDSIWSQYFSTWWTILNNTVTYSTWTAQPINTWNITISWITWEFDSSDVYFVKVEFENAWTNVKTQYLPYFTRSSGYISNTSTNKLTKYTNSELKFPTDLSINWSWKIEISDFIAWKKFTIPTIWTNLTDTDFNTNFDNFAKNTIYSDLKFSEIDFNKNTTDKMLNFKFDYYKNLDCYDDRNNIIKSFIFKKSY